MSALCVTAAVILVSDQFIKLMLRHLMGNDGIALGRYGGIRMLPRQIWLGRISTRFSGSVLWCTWAAAAVMLAACSILAPLNPIFAGLLLGASLSHALETSLRGSVTDFVCIRPGLVFNFADLALAIGAIGLICDLIMIAIRFAA